MKKTLLTSCIIAGFALTLGVNQSQAGPYGTNITIWDGGAPNGDNIGSENNEAELGMVQSQDWDLEGFFLNGTVLTMVGGFDFMNGIINYPTFTSGDIFISTDPLNPADISTTSSNGTIYDNMGYEYALDIDWTAVDSDGNKIDPTFDIRQLDDDSKLTSVYYSANAVDPTSNPWKYEGTENTQTDIISSGSGRDLGTVTDSGFLDWGSLTNYNSDTHYAVSFDLTTLLNAEGLWGSDLYFHFTMGCGNDNLMGKGTAPVPEPATMLLFGTGLIGLAGVARRRSSKK